MKKAGFGWSLLCGSYGDCSSNVLRLPRPLRRPRNDATANRAADANAAAGAMGAVICRVDMHDVDGVIAYNA